MPNKHLLLLILLLSLSFPQPSSSFSFFLQNTRNILTTQSSLSTFHNVGEYIPPYTTTFSSSSLLQMSSTSTSSSTSTPKINTIVCIEYCTGCQWMPRAIWMAQELLTTFQEELDEVCLVPCFVGSNDNPKGGKFAIYLNGKLLWDRKSKGHFPEMKQVKQKVRDVIDPNRNLGHSDVSKEKEEEEEENSKLSAAAAAPSANAVKRPTPHASITYCTGCRWMLRSGWMAQELLTTFQEELNSISLLPARPPLPGGLFTVTLDEKVVWNRKEEGRFPEPKEVKQRIRDVLNPDRDLGHSDVVVDDSSNKKEDENVEKEEVVEVEEMDDDDAAEMRNFFGVA